MLRDPHTQFADVAYVFLDRDGVLNRKPPQGGFVTSVDEFELLPEIPETIAELNRSGRKVIVITNQRGVALGLYSLHDLAYIHDYLKIQLAAAGGHLDAIYVCPHDAGQCNCRKPLTGLFDQAFADFPGAHPANSIMIGDSLRDIEAGVRLGMRTVILADASDRVAPEAQRARELASVSCTSLAEFVRYYGAAKQSGNV